jgi:tetratricopeptide (TPR) repeat protein
MALVLAACGASPKPADPPRLRAALEAESDGARRYGRGDYAAAARRFEEAARLHAAIDDTAGSTRNRLHLARSELALGRAEAALNALAAAQQGSDTAPALDALLLTAQAQLGLARDEDARRSLAMATTQCAGTCPQAASLHLLQARAALAGKRLPDALAHADAALKLLHDKDEGAETGNAWRLLAMARLASGDAVGALPAAQAALDIDRRLAVPEKIARDWLLIGDARSKVSAGEAAAAYRRAHEVAHAAGLHEISTTATQALHALGMQKNLR